MTRGFISQLVRWTFHQTGKANTAFNYPRRFVRAFCKFICSFLKNMCVPRFLKQFFFFLFFLFVFSISAHLITSHFLFPPKNLHSKKTSQLIPTSWRPNHTLFLFLYNAFPVLTAHQPRPFFLFCSVLALKFRLCLRAKWGLGFGFLLFSLFLLLLGRFQLITMCALREFQVGVSHSSPLIWFPSYPDYLSELHWLPGIFIWWVFVLLVSCSLHSNIWDSKNADFIRLLNALIPENFDWKDNIHTINPIEY